jgi:hypothetical protein
VSHKSKDVLNSLAKTAADQFLKNQLSLNSSLKKMASSEGLEPHQVEYVAGEANKLVWANNYKLDKKAAYDFPIADPKSIVSDLQVKPVEKVAEANLDYMLPPSSQMKVASDRVVCGVFESDATKDDDRKSLRKTLNYRYEKLAQAMKDTNADMIAIQSGIENLETKFVKEARQMIMQTPFTDRAEAMEKIAEFVRSANQAHIGRGRELMKKLAAKIVRDGLIKQADLRAPEEYIAEGLPARIVNGNHVLYITIDTINQRQREWDDLNRSFIICDDTLPKLRETIRGL